MKIKSPFEMRGSLGNFTFFINEYGQQAKEGGGPTALQVKTNERFDRTRRNAAEWKGATAASQLFRIAMGHLLEPVNSIRLSSRMNGWLLPAIKGDTVHGYGERMISSGDLSLLRGFEFNHNLELGDALPFNIYNHYSLEGGKLLVDIPAFRIRKKKGLPAGATHYRLVSSIVTIDFDKRKYQQDKQVGAYCKMGNKAGTAFSIGHVVQPPTEQGCFWLMGIEFYKMVNEEPVLVRGGALKVMEWMGKARVEAPVKEDKLIECITVKAEVTTASVVIPQNGVSCPSAGLAGFCHFLLLPQSGASYEPLGFAQAFLRNMQDCYFLFLDKKKVTKEKSSQARSLRAAWRANATPGVTLINNYGQVVALGVAAYACFLRPSFENVFTTKGMFNFQCSMFNIQRERPGGP